MIMSQTSENYFITGQSDKSIELFARPLIRMCYSFGGQTFGPYSYGFQWRTHLEIK